MSKKILVVDDSVFIWEEMKFLLKNSDYEIVAFAKNGEQALTLYESVQPDLVTMDIVLPGIDGIQTAGLLIGKWPEARVIIVSSLAYDETMDEAKSVGARDFLFKPMTAASLIASLDKASAED